LKSNGLGCAFARIADFHGADLQILLPFLAGGCREGLFFFLLAGTLPFM
jgi:hypothetical protein